jgi:hypothetical protein
MEYKNVAETLHAVIRTIFFMLVSRLTLGHDLNYPLCPTGWRPQAPVVDEDDQIATSRLPATRDSLWRLPILERRNMPHTGSDRLCEAQQDVLPGRADFVMQAVPPAFSKLEK